MKKDPEQLKKELTALHRYAIIEYIPQKEKPQIQFLKNRVKTEDLFINLDQYQQRKERFISRSKAMTGYIRETRKCRSRITGEYFGDNHMKDCGICDNCLRKKSPALTNEEFEKIYLLIKEQLSAKKIHSRDLLQSLKGINKEKLWKVIEFLQAENKIEVDKDGWASIKK